MAYDAALAERLRAILAPMAPLTEKRMMGGICFFVQGNMIGGADRAKTGEDRFMFRVGKPNIGKAAALAGGEPMIQGERAMPGFYFVAASGCDDALLRQWAELALGHALSLPPK